MFLARLSSKSTALTRSVSSVTRPRGLAAVLEKKPDDVVITFAKRTAIGRAKKGQLKDTSVDEILHALFKVLTPYFDAGISLPYGSRLPLQRPSWTHPRLMISVLVRIVSG